MNPPPRFQPCVRSPTSSSTYLCEKDSLGKALSCSAAFPLAFSASFSVQRPGRRRRTGRCCPSAGQGVRCRSRSAHARCRTRHSVPCRWRPGPRLRRFRRSPAARHPLLLCGHADVGEAFHEAPGFTLRSGQLVHAFFLVSSAALLGHVPGRPCTCQRDIYITILCRTRTWPRSHFLLTKFLRTE